MKLKPGMVTLLSVALAFLLTGLSPLPASPESKLSAALQAKLDAGPAEFLVILTAQADLSRAAERATKAEKGAYVYRTLRQTALVSQKSLKAWLDERGLSYRVFYSVNALLVRGDQTLALELAARPDVLRLEANPVISNPLPQPEPPSARAGEAAAVEPGLQYVNADAVWALGFTGQGVVIGGQDTGYQWDHPALKNQYRGWNGATADHNYNWHDAIHTANADCPADSPEPCDDVGHGTHTIGTAAGSDGGANRIGMAPGATWIGCRNMDDGNGTPTTYLECFDFFLAPYPLGGNPQTDGNPALAPDVTVNSWSCPKSEGCDWDTLQAAVAAQRAAGIMTVVAATNLYHGTCSTIVDPPAVYDDAYTVGALNTDSDVLAGFSSVGPVTVDGSGRTKPDIAAPGTGTRSAYPGDSYTWMGGTSMATPHVAGAVALLWSAVPTLTNNIAATEAYLNAAAVPIASTACGSAGLPNNYFGYGRLDILAAVEQALTDYKVPPVAELDLSRTIFPAQTATFTGVVRSLRPLTVTWNFGDGETLTGAEDDPVTHTYTAAGAYTVVLTAQNAFGADVASRTVMISPVINYYLPLIIK